jgi:peptidyl-prolyl cis-trans isomerase C
MSDLVATVNGTPIRRSDLDNAIQGLAMQMHRKTMDQLSAEEREEINELALEKLLARELIYQAAMALGVLADAAAVSEEKRKVMANFPTEEEFFATLEKAGIDAAAYHRMLRQDLTVNLMTERQLADLDIEPSEERIAETYRRFPEKMKRPGRVRAAHILIRPGESGREEALRRVREIRALCAEESFGALARRFSDCPSAPGGGDLGYFRRGDMARPFEEAAFSRPVGEIGEPVETQFGFHLIKVLDREEDVPLTLEEATPKIRGFLKEEVAAAALKKWVGELRSAAEIVIM